MLARNGAENLKERLKLVNVTYVVLLSSKSLDHKLQASGLACYLPTTVS